MSRRPGDWTCRACQYVNFCWRDACQRCREGKLGGERAAPEYAYSSAAAGNWDVKPGDWYCTCGVHNYASRSSCFKCRTVKNDSASAVAQSWGSTASVCSGVQSGWRSGDWKCTSCNEHNYASRAECFRCNAPRDIYSSGY